MWSQSCSFIWVSARLSDISVPHFRFKIAIVKLQLCTVRTCDWTNLWTKKGAILGNIASLLAIDNVPFADDHGAKLQTMQFFAT